MNYNIISSEKEILVRALSLYLEKIWDESDKLNSESRRYQEISDEVNLIHRFINENDLVLPSNISARF